jgi:hypothetical protein
MRQRGNVAPRLAHCEIKMKPEFTTGLAVFRIAKGKHTIQRAGKSLTSDHFTCNLLALFHKSLTINGAGEGNRTLVFIPTCFALLCL